MFKKHRQRAKHYTLVSYGTGENEPQSEDEEDENYSREKHAVEFTVLTTSETELDEDFLNNCSKHKSILTLDCDTGILEIGRKLYHKKDMNVLPETKGKGALMFAQRKQRMDEIAAEHEDMRNKGMPVESVQEAEKHYQHQPYMQANDGQNYMDVNVNHQQQHQQFQQYEEQYFHHQQQLQQQQQYQQYQQQMQYEQQHHYQQQHDYQQQQEQQQYSQHQQYQKQVPQYSHNINGMSSHQASVMQSSVINRSAKPFSVQNRAAASLSPSVSQEHYSDGQGEQIASRDERISVPAIKSGILQDSSRRNKSKPMFTFKESPKVSPNPALLNLLHKSDKRVAFDSGAEEDYLSLGAEACNFLQSPKVKDKTPPAVAPKPHINPGSPPWSPEPETAEQQFPQHAENNIPVPTRDSVTKIEPTAVPDQEPPSSPAPERQQAPANTPSHIQPEAVNTWGVTEPHMQSTEHTDTWHENQSQTQLQAKSEPSISSWGLSSTQAHEQPPVSAWGPTDGPLQAQTPNQSNMQPRWVTQSQVNSDVQPPITVQTQSQSQSAWVPQNQVQPQSQPQPQHQPQMNTWTKTPTQSTHQTQWAQSQVQADTAVSTWSQEQNQPQLQPAWAQQQQASQPLSPWTAPQPQSQPTWIQPQSQAQPWASQTQQQIFQQSPVNTWNQPESSVQAQPQWAQQAQPSSQLPSQLQPHQNSWSSAPSQPQSSWTQPTQEHAQQMISSWAPEQNQIPPPWTQQSQTQPQWTDQSQKQASPQAHSQTSSGWTPRPQQVPNSSTASEPQKLAQPMKPWSPPQTSQTTPVHRLNSYTPTPRAPASATSNMSRTGMGSAFEMPALKGKGAELFAKRQSRMEKYVVDSTTVQANQARPSSPSPSLPSSWKYSPNCRAPPPLSYNPLQSPSYPPGAIKQPASSSTTIKNKNKSKEQNKKPAPKPLNVLEVMKHQPYQLKSSLFTYGPAAEKLAAENEAAEKLATQQKAKAQAQPSLDAHAVASGTLMQNHNLRYDQIPAPYGFVASHESQPPQQPYVTSSAMHDGPYQHSPNNYQPAPNIFQQVPYQMHNPQNTYQPPPPPSPYQPPPSLSFQHPPPYQSGPDVSYQKTPTSCFQQVTSYEIPTCPVAARSDSASGNSITAAPKPKFSAKKSDAQVWKPGTPKSGDN